HSVYYYIRQDTLHNGHAKTRGMTALSEWLPSRSRQDRERHSLHFDGACQRERQRMFHTEADLLTLGREHGSRAGAAANGCTDGRAFSASGDGADCGSNTCGTADDSSITLLR